MIYLHLFFGFLQVGLLAFGGGYGAVSLIRDVVLSYGWLTDEAITQMIAISESTPGSIMVNLATYVGSSQAGFLGASVATLAVVLPSFCIILLILAVLKTALHNRFVRGALQGLKPCIIGLILATGLYLLIDTCTHFSLQKTDWRAVVIALLLLGSMQLYKVLRKKAMSPISMICISAVLGIILYSF